MVTDLEGGPPINDGIVAAAPGIAAELLALVRGAGATDA